MNLSVPAGSNSAAGEIWFRFQLLEATLKFLTRIACWLLVVTTYLVASSVAAYDAPIAHVEEDCRVEVCTPVSEDHSPKIVTVWSPAGKLEREHAVFNMNHSTYPGYVPDGMQLQCWRRIVLGGDGATPHKLKLHHRNEVVTFTSSMEIDDHVLGFALRTERL